jgi:hypothetical protein
VFSVPAFGSEWFWESWAGKKVEDYEAFINATEGARFAYADYAHRFGKSSSWRMRIVEE